MTTNPFFVLLDSLHDPRNEIPVLDMPIARPDISPMQIHQSSLFDGVPTERTTHVEIRSSTKK
jgi:hypothetical protein